MPLPGEWEDLYVSECSLRQLFPARLNSQGAAFFTTGLSVTGTEIGRKGIF
jgi:hypothetical protein